MPGQQNYSKKSFQKGMKYTNTSNITRVIVLDTILDCDYRALTETTPPLLRKIETTASKVLPWLKQFPYIQQRIKGTSLSICPDLEAPNLLQAAPAALISYVMYFSSSLYRNSVNFERFPQHFT